MHEIKKGHLEKPNDPGPSVVVLTEFITVMQKEGNRIVGWGLVADDFDELRVLVRSYWSEEVGFDRLEEVCNHVNALKNAEISAGSPMLVALWRDENSKRLIDHGMAQLHCRAKEKEASSMMLEVSSSIESILAEDSGWPEGPFDDCVGKCRELMDLIIDGQRRFKGATSVVQALAVHSERIQGAAFDHFSELAVGVIVNSLETVKSSAQAFSAQAVFC